MRKFNVNIRPTGGYYFIESDGAKLRGVSWSTLAGTVSGYRQRNRMPAGDPMKEIRAQVCQRNPELCSDPDPTPEPVIRHPTKTEKAPPDNGHAMKARIIQWLHALRKLKLQTGQPFKLVPAKEAHDREVVCRNCPMKRAISKGCGSCQQVISEYRKAVTGGDRELASDLEGCHALGIDLRTAVHLDEVRIDNPALPHNCWRKKIL